MKSTILCLLLAALVALPGCKSEKTESTASSETTTVAPAPAPPPAETVAGTATAPVAVQPQTTAPATGTQIPGTSVVITPTQVPGAAPLQPMEAMIASVPRVSPDVAKAELDKGQAVIIDVRGTAYFNSHVKGALDIPETQLPYRLAELPKDKKLITYCT